jgi:hypothetical protein
MLQSNTEPVHIKVFGFWHRVVYTANDVSEEHAALMPWG